MGAWNRLTHLRGSPGDGGEGAEGGERLTK